MKSSVYKELEHRVTDLSCNGRGICPSCNTRRMVETAAHLIDHVFPLVPMRQWVLSFPKGLLHQILLITGEKRVKIPIL